MWNAILGWVKDLLLWIPRELFSLFVDGLASLADSIPVPDFLAMAANLFSGITSGVWWWLSFFLIPQGFSLVMGAYAARFLLRRIPFIG